ncbi:Nif3-like dinuclear metal center hexameric protein [Intrasporangium mesophilum]
MDDLLLRDVVAALESLYPPETAAGWDRVGLVTGDLEQPVRRILLAVDPTLAVIREAAHAQTDLLVTHHPLLLRGVSSVATTTAKGASVTGLIASGVALYVAHTNADVAEPGVSSVIASTLGLTAQRALSVEDGQPLGRVGELPETMSLREFADLLAAVLPPTAGGIRVSGDPAGAVRTVAVLGGSGDDRFPEARACGADVYVTADLRHHPVLEAREETRDGPPYLVDAGHWATESLWLASARDRLLAVLAERHPAATRVDTRVSEIRTEPWTFVVGANAAGPDSPATQPGGVS